MGPFQLLFAKRHCGGFCVHGDVCVQCSAVALVPRSRAWQYPCISNLAGPTAFASSGGAGCSESAAAKDVLESPSGKSAALSNDLFE